MADQEEAPVSTEPGAGPDGTDRMERLESKVDRLAEAVAALVPGSREEAQDRTEQRLDRPTSVEEQVAHALAQAQQAQDEENRRAQLAGDVAGLKDDVAKMRERPPAAPVPLRQKLLGWTQ